MEYKICSKEHDNFLGVYVRKQARLLFTMLISSFIVDSLSRIALLMLGCTHEYYKVICCDYNKYCYNIRKGIK